VGIFGEYRGSIDRAERDFRIYSNPKHGSFPLHLYRQSRSVRDEKAYRKKELLTSTTRYPSLRLRFRRLLPLFLPPIFFLPQKFILPFDPLLFLQHSWYSTNLQIPSPTRTPNVSSSPSSTRRNFDPSLSFSRFTSILPDLSNKIWILFSIDPVHFFFC